MCSHVANPINAKAKQYADISYHPIIKKTFNIKMPNILLNRRNRNMAMSVQLVKCCFTGTMIEILV